MNRREIASETTHSDGVLLVERPLTGSVKIVSPFQAVAKPLTLDAKK